MLRWVKIAAVLLVLLAVSACHKTLPPPPPPPPPPTPAAASSTAAQPAHRPKLSAPQTPSPPAAQPAAPEFRLGQELTPEEARANNAEIDRHIQHVTQALATIGNRTLTADRKSTVTQIRGFIAQAQQMRASDVVRARSLAERADILTQDLMSSLK
jgi:hypothetical protein